ncbi:MAG TPA: TolC family protein [Vicinamibacterales bacterium]
MIRSFRFVVFATVLVGGAMPVHAQNPATLSLHDAEQAALKNHPEIQAAQFGLQAAREAVRETRSAYFPTAFGSITGADAENGSRIAAGGLNNPIIFDRFATGISIGQLVTDFGRTRALVQSSSLTAQSRDAGVLSERASVLLDVDRTYFGVLRAQAVQRVAQETVNARQIVVDQVAALAASGLKSGLDLSFARVNLATAQLLLVQAQNDTDRTFAALAAAIGLERPVAYAVTDLPLPSAPPLDVGPLLDQAMHDRPDLVEARFSAESATKLADAERDLFLPSVTAVGSFGVTPYHQTGINDRYAAVGVNVNVPIMNGNLFAARHSEALYRAEATTARVRQLQNLIARDVNVAWLNARTAFQRLDLTNQLLDQASQALDLAQSRYNLGLSSIVELSQAQLNKTDAELEQASAKYEYQVEAAVLGYQIGVRK